jgi:4-aminobutyrate aminotransferase/(S)-3-amino-2-methylpropionate transaminase
MFATNYWAEAGVQPDLMTSAKSIAAGMPLSSVTGRTEIIDSAGPGEVGGTYCGNPLSCAAGLKVIEIMERDDYPGKALAIGEHCKKHFDSWKEKYEILGDVRVIGAMMALEFVTDKASKTPAKDKVDAIIAENIKSGLITMSAGVAGNSMRFLMPLCITNEQLDAGLNILEASIAKVNG